ncbi:MAG: glutamate racemase [Verrucomicrobiota bacterium]
MSTSFSNPSEPAGNTRPIGVFDSGIGGLTVAAALREVLPGEDIFYIGDTARVPYGGKSASTIERYSLEISGMLLAEGAKMIVVACNTASALAVPRLQELLRVPVIGVIQPGGEAAVAATRNGHVGVIATRATIKSQAYEKVIQSLNPAVKVSAQECPLLVPLIEEGWLDDSVTNQVIARYLDQMVGDGIDTLVLGCTHYPLLRKALAAYVGDGITLVDSAQNCAMKVDSVLKERGLSSPAGHIGELRIALTDPSSAFLRVAEDALGLKVGEVQVRAVQMVNP